MGSGLAQTRKGANCGGKFGEMLGGDVRMSRSQWRIAAMLAAILAGGAAAGCDSAPQKRAPAAPAAASANSATPAVPEDVQAAARAAYGADGEVLGYGDFPAAGGQQALVIYRLAAGALPGAAAAGTTSPGGGGASAAPAQSGETAADVIHVSLLVRDGPNWKEAFRADEHLKNRRGYLGGTPAYPVPAWHLVSEKTANDGFKMVFTPLSIAPGSKPVTVRVAWNGKRQEYDSLDATGTQFFEPRSTPGGASVKMKP
jgi:hypothetical protein